METINPLLTDRIFNDALTVKVAAASTMLVEAAVTIRGLYPTSTLSARLIDLANRCAAIVAEGKENGPR